MCFGTHFWNGLEFSRSPVFVLKHGIHFVVLVVAFNEHQLMKMKL